MHNDQKGCSRRQFLKAAGAAGVGSLLAAPALARPMPQTGQPAVRPQAAANAKVPMRPFGKSGRQVSILSLGGMFDIAANQMMLRQAVNWGVTYWDTANSYHKGSESGIGRYFSRYPDERKDIFLVTKAGTRDPQRIEAMLNNSLTLMNTSYIDLFFIHAIRGIDEMSDEIRKWAEKAKAEGKIRLFGFSTHNNMEACLQGAARLDWIDGIMMTYNFRNMQTPQMQKAVDACVQAGIGLTAMKTQAGASWFDWSKSTAQAKELAERFRQKGFTEEQAKLKAVWQDSHIASICSQMDSMRLLKANFDAAVDETPLSAGETRLFQQYACETADQYCTGCHHICETALAGQVPVSDIMRYHMYCQSYGKAEWARSQFNALPAETRRQMAMVDYTEAENRCPRKMPIGRLMRQALEDYA
jgi:uncharacterized protein